MPISTLVGEPPLATEHESIERSASAPALDAERGGRAWPLVAMACGLAVLAAAATLVVRAGDDASTVTVDPAAITLAARDVSVVVQVYLPGEQSGWHAHTGIHAVAVIEGVLTVYEGQCQPATFEPGRPYVGGQQPHLVRNETDLPVRMVVTYLSPSGPATPTGHMAPPTGCATG